MFFISMMHSHHHISKRISLHISLPPSLLSSEKMVIINFKLTNSLHGFDSRYINKNLYVIFLFNSLRTYRIANGQTINILLTRFESSVFQPVVCSCYYADPGPDSDLEDLQYNLMKATNLKSFDCVLLCLFTNCLLCLTQS